MEQTTNQFLGRDPYSPDHKFLWAVQWHPEFSYQTNENSRLIGSSSLIIR